MLFLLVCLLFIAPALSQVGSNGTSNTGVTCSCGLTSRARIVGGKEAGRHEYPSMVSIEFMDSHWCGGSIITPWHVLTAAHCTFGLKVDYNIIVSVGGHIRLGPSEARIRVAKIMAHEGFSPITQVNDISLLMTEEQIPFSHKVGPVCMPTGRLNLVGQKVQAAGWGNTADQGQYSDTLQTVALTVISNARCIRLWKVQPQYTITNATNMCTFEKKKDTCLGDSGGPLMFTDPKIHRVTLAALVSFGGACAGGLPGVNVDVTAYLDWINRNIESSRPGTRTCTAVQ